MKFVSSGAHDHAVGDTVYHYSFSEPTYNGRHKIVEVISSTEYRIESVVYVSNVGGYGESRSNIRPNANNFPQSLMWYDLVPYGAAVLERRIVIVDKNRHIREHKIYNFFIKNQQY